MIMTHRGFTPEIESSAFVAENASVIGDVKVGPLSSIWFGAVIRGDESPIRIGNGTSVQDNCVLHCDRQSPMNIGNNCTLGHGCIVHGATIGNNVLIGMGAVVLNGATVGDNSIIAAGAVVKENAVIPPNSLAAGVPASVRRTLSQDEIADMEKTSYYVKLSREYIEEEKSDDTL